VSLSESLLRRALGAGLTRSASIAICPVDPRGLSPAGDPVSLSGYRPRTPRTHNRPTVGLSVQHVTTRAQPARFVSGRIHTGAVAPVFLGGNQQRHRGRLIAGPAGQREAATGTRRAVLSCWKKGHSQGSDSTEYPQRSTAFHPFCCRARG